MKNIILRKLSVLLVFGFCVAVYANSTVIAQTSTASNSTVKADTITSRVTERKNTLKLQLNSAQTQKITKNCVDAQKTIKVVAAQDKSNATKRQHVYTNTSTRLNKVIDGLNKRSVDTAELASIRDQFNTAANQYLVDASTYKTTMEDLSVMDCSAEPTGFQATLTSGRQLRIKLANEVGQIKSTKTALAQSLTKATGLLNSKNAQGTKL
jgi:small-conductance mechanosensitive channel